MVVDNIYQKMKCTSHEMVQIMVGVIGRIKSYWQDEVLLAG